MPYRDLREFLDHLEKEGELARVREPVDLEYEMGAVCRHVLDRKGPALLFEHPRGCSVPVVAGVFATRRRFAMALETSVEEVHQEWIRRTKVPLAPRLVATGPCKENILSGKDVDVRRFSIPTWNEKDGGPYITLPCHITKDPVSGERNAAVYRTQVHDRNTVGILAAPYRHLAQHRARAGFDRPFPVAIALGLDPVIHISSTSCFPLGVDELAMAGALRGEPVELVKCETIPVEVPAHAEIVLEGEILPGELEEEGLFGEFTGYYGLREPRPVIRITAITHRNNPIHLATYEGRPPQETNVLMGVPAEVEILRTVSIPGIVKVHLTEGGCSAFNAVVSINKPFEGYGKMMGLSVLGTWGGRYIKNLIVVDADVDPYDLTQVEWALATRVQPKRDVEILGDLTGITLDPSLSEDERRSGKSRTSKMIIDATRYDAGAFEEPCGPKRDVMERVVREWRKYGIEC